MDGSSAAALLEKHERKLTRRGTLGWLNSPPLKSLIESPKWE